MNFKKIVIWTGILLIILILLGISDILNNNNNNNNNNSINENNQTYFNLEERNHDFTIMYEGLERNYLVYVPKSYNSQIPTPVVLAFHGRGGNSKDGPRFFQIEKLADKENFIVVYPQGTGEIDLLTNKIRGQWNVGISGRNLTYDDVGFVSLLISKLKKDFNINENRIHAIGHSNGALMAHYLACELSNEIASIAVGGAHGINMTFCNPNRPVSILHFQGLQDLCSPTEGGSCGCVHIVPENSWECASLDEFIENWLRINKCLDKKEKVYENATAICYKYSECENNEEIKVCTIGNMGHTWPGNDFGVEICNNQNSVLCKYWIKMVGNISNDIQGNEMFWEFLKNHPKN